MCLMDNMGAAHFCMAEATLLAMTESYILEEIAVKTPEFSVGNMPLSTDRIKTLSSSPLACQCYQRTLTLRWTSVCPERQHLAAGRRCQSLLTGFLLPLTQHMREAAERRQQLELEHEQALAVLNAKQQEIELLQKVSGKGQVGGNGRLQWPGTGHGTELLLWTSLSHHWFLFCMVAHAGVTRGLLLLDLQDWMNWSILCQWRLNWPIYISSCISQ